MTERNPLSFLIDIKKRNINIIEAINRNDSNISGMKDAHKGIIFAHYIEECSSQNQTPIQFTPKEWIYIINNSNIVKINTDKNLFHLYKSSIKNSCPQIFKELITLLYSKILLINKDFIIDEDINYYQSVYINQEYSLSPFYYILCLNKKKHDDFKYWLNNQKSEQIKEKELIDFCLSTYNLKAALYISKKFKYYNFLTSVINLNFYELKNRELLKSYTNLVKFLWNKDSNFNEHFLFLKESLPKDSLTDPWFWETAKKYEDDNNVYFCNELELSPQTINNIKKYNLNKDFSHTSIKKITNGLYSLLKNFPEYYEQIRINHLLESKRKVKPLINKLTLKDYYNIYELFKDKDSNEEIVLETFNPGGLGSHLQKEIKMIRTEKELSNLIFGKSSKKSLSHINYLLDGIFLREERLFWSYYLKTLDFNYDLRLNFLKDIKDYSIHTVPEEDVIDLLSEMRTYFNDKKILSLLKTLYLRTGMSHIDISEYVISDIISQLKLIKESDKYEFAIKEVKKHRKDIKDIKLLHEFLSNRIIRYIEQKDFPLEQDNIYFLESFSFKDLNLYVPKTNHELISIGDELDICVGDGYYSESIKNKEIFIITLKSNDTHIYCIEWNILYKSIIQCNTEKNKEMDPELKRELKDFIIKKLEEGNV